MTADLTPRTLQEIRLRADADEKKRLANLEDDAPTVLWCNSDAERAHLDRVTLLAALDAREIPEPEVTLETRRAGKIQRGQFTGWCTTCGGNTYNFVRHRCPPKIEERVYLVMRAASLLVRRRTAVRTATRGTVHHERMLAEEGAAYDELAAAVATANQGNTNGEET